MVLILRSSGLFSFASTTLILSLYNVQARGIRTPNVVVGMALFVGGLAQLLAGMWEFAAANTFGATGTSFVVKFRTFSSFPVATGSSRWAHATCQALSPIAYWTGLLGFVPLTIACLGKFHYDHDFSAFAPSLAVSGSDRSIHLQPSRHMVVSGCPMQLSSSPDQAF